MLGSILGPRIVGNSHVVSSLAPFLAQVEELSPVVSLYFSDRKPTFEGS